MKYIVIFLFIIILGAGLFGYFYEFEEVDFGKKLIGLSILAFSFIWMPLFIYYRYKNKKVEDYILSQEKLKEMNDFNKRK